MVKIIFKTKSWKNYGCFVKILRGVAPPYQNKRFRPFMSILKKTCENVPPSNIVIDKTNLCDDPGRRKVIVKREVQHPERVINSSKVAILIMIAGAADGHVLPPYVIYKSEYLWDSWVCGGPPGCRYNRNSSGWFDLALFEHRFLKIALKYFNTLEGPNILIGDNLTSYISLSVILKCEKHDINCILLPPNSTHYAYIAATRCGVF